jgi:chromosomal replication initiator protein
MHDDRLWQAVLGEIEVSVSSGNYSTWFKNTRLLRYDQETLVIGVPNVFVQQQLERKFSQLLMDTVQKHGLKPKHIQYKSLPNAKTNKKIEEDVIVFAPAADEKPGRAKNSLAHSYRQGLSNKFTFDTFVVGSSNELAYATAQGAAASPGTKYNPLSLYGGVGIGKTHLMQAVGNAVLKENPDAKVTYVTSEQFTQEFIDAVRYKKNTEFASFYRSSDVLIIDDVQFFAGKEKTLEEFFHTFNALYQANKQIIISSDRPPNEISGLEDRLKSRFMQGMSVDMQIPDYETRCAIVQSKAISQGMELPQDVVEFLANNLRSNIRELEGALNQLVATCAVKNLEPDVPLARSVLGSHRMRPKHLTPKQIVERTARHFSVSVDEILGPKRDKDIVLPRQVAMYLMRSELHLSFPKIANELGRKDHTTAMHSIEKIEKESAVDNVVKSALNDIKGRLYA